MRNNQPTRRQTMSWMATSAAALSIPGIAHASAWAPTGNITYNIGVAPGGSVDLYARGIQKSLETLNLVGGYSVIPQNRPGAAGLLVLQALQKNKGNGHQLGTFHTGSIAGQVTGVLKADIREFVPVAMMVEETTLVAVAQSSTLKGVQDLVAQLQRNPASLKIAVAPLRGLNLHLAIAKPLKLAGIDVSELTVVPFRSSGESMAALLGGHVDVAMATGPTVVPMAQARKIRMLASCSASRGTGPLATVITWREIGIAADYVSYNGVLLAPGIDVDQIRFWETALSKVAASSEWRQLVERSGNKPIFKGFSDSHRYLESEIKETQALVSSLGGVAR